MARSRAGLRLLHDGATYQEAIESSIARELEEQGGRSGSRPHQTQEASAAPGRHGDWPAFRRPLGGQQQAPEVTTTPPPRAAPARPPPEVTTPAVVQQPLSSAASSTPPSAPTSSTSLRPPPWAPSRRQARHPHALGCRRRRSRPSRRSSGLAGQATAQEIRAADRRRD